MVLKGSDLTELLGTPINQILGYSFNANGQWTQIPIQIDEMHFQKWETIKHEPDCRKVWNKQSTFTKIQGTQNLLEDI